MNSKKLKKMTSNNINTKDKDKERNKKVVQIAWSLECSGLSVDKRVENELLTTNSRNNRE